MVSFEGHPQRRTATARTKCMICLPDAGHVPGMRLDAHAVQPAGGFLGTSWFDGANPGTAHPNYHHFQES